ncbi:TM0996/MTH895 family glutaredoxin-like protein [bacterium]|nr:TM0996/MTH895 family glutaredoxin-like protein [bacterium]
MIKLQILGTGCPKCEELAKNAELAAETLGIKYEIVKIKDINEIMQYGVMLTPALAINGEVKSAGKVLLPVDIMKLLHQYKEGEK